MVFQAAPLHGFSLLLVVLLCHACDAVLPVLRYCGSHYVAAFASLLWVAQMSCCCSECAIYTITWSCTL